MSITVLKSGLLTSIQDLGRNQYQKYGIIVSGAMDTFSLRLSNILVGNDEGEAVIEITLLGPSLIIDKGMLISITGANLSPTIDGMEVPMNRPIYLHKKSVLKFGSCKFGCRSYLAVAGGYKIEEVMKSKSTYIRAGIGGFKGRALKKEDSIEINPQSNLSKKIINSLCKKDVDSLFTYPNWYIEREIYNLDDFVRVIHERQFSEFNSESQNNFFNSKFSISTQSDRMGYRLTGEELKLKEHLEMISEPVSFGTIQVPPDGKPIVLLADRQTTGGYPKIAKIVDVDICKVVQKKPGEFLRFKEVSLKEAEELYIERERYINNLKTAINLKL